MKKYYPQVLLFLLLTGVFGTDTLLSQESSIIPSTEMRCPSPKQGPPGIPGLGGAGASYAYGGFYLIPPSSSGNITTLASFGEQVPMSNTSGSQNTSVSSSGTVLINLPGDYLVTYGVSIYQFSDQATIPTFVLTLNGNQVLGSRTSVSGARTSCLACKPFRSLSLLQCPVQVGNHQYKRGI